MEYSAVKEKSDEELQRILAETREALRKARFSASQKQLKNVRVIREHKKTIARIRTRLPHA
ncbi:50S ribosomal protein L29 [Candidatus Uhrbacteria bacterium]|nr:50S ribosomal protein L29 [Candidatus Uhrbacteria bacterium]